MVHVHYDAQHIYQLKQIRVIKRNLQPHEGEAGEDAGKTSRQVQTYGNNKIEWACDEKESRKRRRGER